MNHNEISFLSACQNGNLMRVKDLIIDGLKKACENEKLNVIEYLGKIILNDITVENSLQYAGYISEIVDWWVNTKQIVKYFHTHFLHLIGLKPFRWVLSRACFDKNVDLAIYMIEKIKINISEKDENGNRIFEGEFLSACHTCNFGLVELFLNNGYSLDKNLEEISTEDGMNAVCKRILYDSNKSDVELEIIKLLIHHGADIHRKHDEYKYNPYIKSCCCQGNLNILSFLVELGVEIEGNAFCELDQNYLQMVLLNGNHETSFEIVKILIQNGCDPDHREDDQDSCFIIAAKRGRLIEAQFLISQGCLIYENDMDFWKIWEGQHSFDTGLRNRRSRRFLAYDEQYYILVFLFENFPEINTVSNCIIDIIRIFDEKIINIFQNKITKNNELKKKIWIVKQNEDPNVVDLIFKFVHNDFKLFQQILNLKMQN